MRDQAENLRIKLKNLNSTLNTKTIAVVSGKGGVGKSNFSLNFALDLSRSGHKVLLFDMDIGMGNIDILMGVSPKSTIVNLFESNLMIKDIIEEGPEGLSFISGGSGFTKIFKFGSKKIDYFISQLELLLGEYDYVIFDMAAGVTEESLQIAIAADELFVITTTEPTSITDAYATIKFFSLKDKDMPIFLLINRAHSENEAKSTVNRLRNVVHQFLKKEVTFLGYLPDDQVVFKAVKRQIPFLLFEPNANVSKALLSIVKRYKEKAFDENSVTSSFKFITKLKQFFLER